MLLDDVEDEGLESEVVPAQVAQSDRKCLVLAHEILHSWSKVLLVNIDISGNKLGLKNKVKIILIFLNPLSLDRKVVVEHSHQFLLVNCVSQEIEDINTLPQVNTLGLTFAEVVGLVLKGEFQEDFLHLEVVLNERSCGRNEVENKGELLQNHNYCLLKLRDYRSLLIHHLTHKLN